MLMVKRDGSKVLILWDSIAEPERTYTEKIVSTSTGRAVVGATAWQMRSYVSSNVPT